MSKSGKRELYGQERLEILLSGMAGNTPKEITDEVEKDLVAFADGYYQSDDITMLTLKYLG